MPLDPEESIASILKKRMDDNYVRVNLEWLKTDRSYDFDLFALVNGQFLLFCRKKLNLTKKMTLKLKKSSLYIDKREAPHFQSYMEENIADIVADTTKPLIEKSEAVYAVSTNLINDLLNEPKAASIGKVKNLVDSQMSFVMGNPGAVTSLMSITEHDYYTYTHSMNVAIYLVGLGKQMGLSGDEIQKLSLGGMLHDLGKAKIPLEIINSTGKLSKEEFEEMQKHPSFGVELLKKLDEVDMIPQECYKAILHHHEKFEGGGYPCKICGEDIHIYGRMTKVCDVFDALTTKRSYKDAMTSFDSLKLMKEKMSGEFDPDVFGEFLKLMADFSLSNPS
ncbi:MAG: HD-GYP domain-containing protein [Planctomycetes bacterium]|nr:HD-GYP domain-containing protein [Planctomycetota bacterium]